MLSTTCAEALLHLCRYQVQPADGRCINSDCGDVQHRIVLVTVLLVPGLVACSQPGDDHLSGGAMLKMNFAGTIICQCAAVWRASSPSLALMWMITLFRAANTTLPNVEPCGMTRISALFISRACTQKQNGVELAAGKRGNWWVQKQHHITPHLLCKGEALHVREPACYVLVLSRVDLEVVVRLCHRQDTAPRCKWHALSNLAVSDRACGLGARSTPLCRRLMNRSLGSSLLKGGCGARPAHCRRKRSRFATRSASL